jgi:4-methylaminobutanoate oxidase (formaldehyde-forming)
MRIEKGFAAMGHELDGDITPVETGMDRMVSRDMAFIGAEALEARRKTGHRSLMTVLFDDPEVVPLGHEPIYLGEEIVGHTTSAAFGYRIGRPVALAHVHAADADGAEVEVDVTGTRHRARLQFAPAFDPAGERMRP